MPESYRAPATASRTTPGPNETPAHPGHDVPEPCGGAPIPADQRYRAVRLHAKGGLGEVHVAEDAELNRTVALKRMQERVAEDGGNRARFLREAEVTARLQHPGIVPVYGLAQDADGRPAYAMRFIEGESLADAIRTFYAGDRPRYDGLEFRTLAQRFVAVCHAVAYAHSQGVVHRDLKPANVMLGKYGETLVVDWGLAKAAGGGAARGDAGDTLLGEAVGTPAYMSPEQAAGRWDILGPASDVYSLGATLYDVLTGRPAFGGSSVATTLDAVRAGHFAPPRAVCPGLPAALEAICLKAMALAPTDRYDSAESLAVEVEHWLADEPVRAHREPPSVKAWRWVRRHRTPVVGLAALLATATVALAVVAVQSEKARLAITKERDAARDDRLRALDARASARDALEAIMSGAVESALAVQRRLSPEQVRFLKTALLHYERFAAEPGEDRLARERLAKVNYRLGMIHKGLEMTREAAGNFRRCVDLYGQLAAEEPGAYGYRYEVANSLTCLGVQLQKLEQLDEAAATFRDAIDRQERLAAEAPDRVDARRDMGMGLNSLGTLLMHKGETANARETFRRAVAVQEALIARDRDNTEYPQTLAGICCNLGMLSAAENQLAEAETAYRRGQQLLEHLAKRRPDVVAFQRELAMIHNNLGDLMERRGQHEEAVTAYRGAAKAFQRNADAFPSEPLNRLQLSVALGGLANALARVGRREEAEGEYRRALALQEKFADDHKDVPHYRHELAMTCGDLANSVRDGGRAQDALEWYARAIRLLEPEDRRLPSVRQPLRNAHVGRAKAHTLLGRHGDAIADWDRAVELTDGREKMAVRVERAGGLLAAGQVASALAEVDAAVAANDASPEALYDGACVYARAAGRPDTTDRERQGARAVELLRRAVAAGFRDAAHVTADADLAVLRPRDDFAALLWTLADSPPPQ